MRQFLLMTTLAIPALSASAAVAGNMLPEGVTIHDSAKGEVLANAAGMTLYTFDKDTRGVSNCTGGCAEKWPPLIVPATEKVGDGFSLVTRKDGARQIAHDGMPLYTWFKDAKPGDITGNGVKGVWHIAKP